MKKIQFFMLGIITALGALFLELLIFTLLNLNIGPSSSYSNSLNLTIIFSIFLEESVKIIILFQILKKIIQAGARQQQIFLSALMAGLGFSVMEILLNLLNSQINYAFSLSDVFGLLIVHMGTFAILGYALAKKIDLSFSQLALLFPLVFLFHLFYNAIVIYQLNSGFYFLFTISSLLLMLAFWKDLKRQFKEENLPKSEIRL